MNRIIILVLVLAVLLLSACGCSVELVDHTPEEFPATDWPPFNLPFPVQRELMDLGGMDKHRFRVEVKSRYVNVSSIQAWIWLGGKWHPMSGEGAGIWYYDSPEKCNEEYSYALSATYAGKEQIGAELPTNLSKVEVTAFGQVSWYVGNTGPVFSGNGPNFISEGEEIELLAEDERAKITVQNLKSRPVRVSQVLFTGREPDDEDFELLNLPPDLFTEPSSVVLNCGETFEFRVGYSPQGGGGISHSEIHINVVNVNPGGFESPALLAFIKLRGSPNPP